MTMRSLLVLRFHDDPVTISTLFFPMSGNRRKSVFLAEMSRKVHFKNNVVTSLIHFGQSPLK